MDNNLEFTPIDMNTWKRKEIFYYFSKMAPTGYSITTEVDITNMRNLLKEKQIKFFPAYLWLVTKTLMEQAEFKIAIREGVLGKYKNLTPLYATFHEDDKTFSLMWTEYNESFMEFYENYLKNKIDYGNNHGVLAQKGILPPSNAYTISCIPWITFSHFAVHTYENKAYYFPSVEAGKFIEKDSKILMPLSITCHHATTDGYHVNLFLEQFDRYIKKFEQYI